MGLLDKFKKDKRETEKKPTAKKESVVDVIQKEEKKPKLVKKVVKKEYSDAYRILMKPLVTEKSVNVGDALNQYVFVVAPNASKNEVRKAVQDLYGVAVRRVNIINVPGKKRQLGQREGFRPGFKKAIVSLAVGEKIEVISR
jgi:large subunit ribosomal protein L23